MKLKVNFPVVLCGLALALSCAIHLICSWNISQILHHHHNVTYTCSYAPNFTLSLQEAISWDIWDSFYSCILIYLGLFLFTFIIVSTFFNSVRHSLHTLVSAYAYFRFILIIIYYIQWQVSRKALTVVLGFIVYFNCPIVPEWAMQNWILLTTRSFLIFVDFLVLILIFSCLEHFKTTPRGAIRPEVPLPTYEDVIAPDMELPTYSEALATAAARHCEVVNECDTPPQSFRRAESFEEDSDDYHTALESPFPETSDDPSFYSEW